MTNDAVYAVSLPSFLTSLSVLITNLQQNDYQKIEKQNYILQDLFMKKVTIRFIGKLKYHENMKKKN